MFEKFFVFGQTRLLIKRVWTILENVIPKHVFENVIVNHVFQYVFGMWLAKHVLENVFGACLDKHVFNHVIEKVFGNHEPNTLKKFNFLPIDCGITVHCIFCLIIFSIRDVYPICF